MEENYGNGDELMISICMLKRTMPYQLPSNKGND
jgi:hypothetical protein